MRVKVRIVPYCKTSRLEMLTKITGGGDSLLVEDQRSMLGTVSR